MASTSSTCILLFLFFLHFSCFFNNLNAKHSITNNHKHLHRHNNNHNPPSNIRLHRTFLALQAWKQVIYSDPNNITSNWVGPSVCNYTGIYCAPSLDDPKTKVVAGIDLNHADIAGFLPDELAFLCDLSILHLNSNRFCGIIPKTFANLTHLSELDLSNNRFVGPFPSVVLSLPSLAYLDLRYNEFEGPLPSQLFDKPFDAFFLNNNRFTSSIPRNLGKSKASVMVFANNKFGGCLPESIVNFADTLEELLLINTSISGCLPIQVGFLYKLRVLDVSFNNIVGPIPYSLSGLSHLEQLNIGHNMMSGIVPMGVCALPNLVNFTFSYNFFCEEEGICKNLTSKKIVYDDRRNCLPNKALQRSEKECKTKLEQPPVDCFEVCCDESGSGQNVSVGYVAVPPSAIPVAAMPVSPPVLAPRYP
ncbi:leucine-rich repeat extensin-like protein 4 [Vicia villosa]|uniref:leucine-rich repeat extensin-like protein 4 n=1 Tax=Vicia villosa TaxID=3911 RepID=UPI00273B4538|nr:leucine-rich repeat extensin-like protein 4 [Vicia villosa]